MTATTQAAIDADVAGPVIAHRGASLVEPENTLASLIRAKQMGCDWVEIDAQVTRDGAVVLMHDHSVNRTTDGRGALAMMTLEQVQTLRTLDPSTGQPTEHRVPSLTEAIETCLEQDLGLVLEFKATWGSDLEDAEAVAEICNTAWPRDNGKLIVTSFSAIGIARFGEVCPWAKTGLACLPPPPNPGRLMERLGVNGFHVNGPYVTPENLERVLASGAEVAVATINESAEAQRLLDMGAMGIISDRPDLLE
ncbi:MAG: glycerophosphodiester phosphodiesterase family protein [Pseudomonadota bacterium]